MIKEALFLVLNNSLRWIQRPVNLISTMALSFMYDLEDGVEPGEHVLELLLLLVGEGGDHGLHLARLEVRHLEHVLHQQLRVDQPGPREQVDEPENIDEGKTADYYLQYAWVCPLQHWYRHKVTFQQ